MIKWFYESWGVLTIISAAVGLISAVVAVCKDISKKTDRKYNYILWFVCTVCVSFVTVSLIVGNCFSEVPDVIGRTLYDAKYDLLKVGLNIVVEPGITTEEMKDRYVEWQSIDAGEPAIKDSSVMVLAKKDTNVIDTAESTIIVPNVVGENLNDAVYLLASNGIWYQINNLDDYISVLSQCYVVSQTIPGGSSVPQGSIVELELSAQEADIPEVQEPDDDNMVTVPNLVGMGEHEAAEALAERGLLYQIYWLEGTNESADYYYIVYQSIPARSKVPAGTLIELERSDISPIAQVVVPNVVGMEQTEATKLLTESGLQFQVWWTQSEADTEPYYILEQSIPAGSIVDARTLVRLQLTSTKP